jgi:hypothetical protein
VDKLMMEILKVGAMAARYAEHMQNTGVQKLGYLAQAAKSHLAMLQTEQGANPNSAPPTVQELLWELKTRFRIPKEPLPQCQENFGPKFWRDLETLTTKAEAQNEDIVLSQQEYEGWIKRAEDVVMEHGCNPNYSREYECLNRGIWVGRLLHKHGAEAFNTLRERHPSWIPQLRLSNDRSLLTGVNFSNSYHPPSDLGAKDLSYCYFRGSLFYEMKLAKVNLTWANLSNCKMEKADLREADLFSADLRGAHLQGADLRGANLSGADMEGALLAGARLEGATMPGTWTKVADIAQVSLYGVKGILKFQYRQYLHKLRASIEFDKTGL